MPNIKSAKKRVSIEARRRGENKYVKATMATMIKKFRATVVEDTDKADKMLRSIISYIDSASSKGVIHKNTASRKVSRLSALLDKVKASKKEKEKKEEVAKEAEATKTKSPEEKPEEKKEVKKESKLKGLVKKIARRSKKEEKKVAPKEKEPKKESKK